MIFEPDERMAVHEPEKPDDDKILTGNVKRF